MVIRAGDVVTFGGPVRKDVAGYDLRSLFIGSEGTLGIITGAWLRLIPAPEASHTVIAGYRDFRSGVAGLGRVLAYGLTPATLEYFDEGCVGATRRAFPGGLSDDVNFLVLSETDGSAGEADRISDQLMDALKQDAVFLSRTHDPRATAALTRWRSGVSFAVSAQRGGKMSEDIVVPFDKLAAAIQMLGDLEAQFHLPSCSWGHAGDGNLHATFMVDAASPEEITRAELATEALFARALEMHGSVSGEHGLGWVKRSQFHRQFGPAEASLLMGIKLLFDPDNIFNPGKKVILPHE